MGPSHAISGGAVWLAGCAAATTTLGADLSWQAVVVGAVVCAGWALASDLDHPDSTVANYAGPVSRLAAHGIAWAGVRIHAATRTRWDRPDEDGHRTFSHTAVYAVVMGVAAAAGGRYGGPWVAAVLVALAADLAGDAALPGRWWDIPIKTGFRIRFMRRPWAKGLFGRTGQRWARNCRRVNIPTSTLLAAALGWAAYQLTPADAWWLGLAVGTGVLVHCAGDMLTDSACPVAWPLPLGPPGQRRRWYPLGPPRWMRFHTDGLVERWLVRPALVAGAAASTTVLLFPLIQEKT
jgi:membrane-bound metal-dependent hydrolase YbcI (DUF457 family)